MSAHRLIVRACTHFDGAFGHRLCCRIPGWLAGPRWRSVDEAPWNPYNAVWRLGQWILKHTE